MLNQAIVGWIGSALLLNARRDGRTLLAAAFIVPISLLWATFVAFGLAILAVALLLFDAPAGRIRLTRVGSLQLQVRAALPDLALGMTIAVAVAAYLFLVFRLDETVFDPASLARPYARELTQLDETLAFPAVYLGFLFVEFMTLALLLAHRTEWRDRNLFLALVTTAMVLTVMPLFRLGFINDFALKASIAPLFVFELLLLIAWVRGNSGNRRLLLAYLLLAGASGAASLINFARHDVTK